MIQLSTLSATGLETPGKTAGLAAPDGLFASLLDLGLGEAAMPGGKILPEGGKVLPDGLPVDVPGMSLSALTAQIVAIEPAVFTDPKTAAALPEGEALAAAPVLPDVPAAIVPFKPRVLDLSEPVGAELVEPVAVEPVDVIASELPDTVQPDLAAGDLPIVVAPLPLPIVMDKTPVTVAAPAEAKTASSDPLPAATQDKPAPERQPAQQAAAATPAPVQAPRIVLPLATLAAATKSSETPADTAPAAVREPAQLSAASTRVQPVAELKLALSADRHPASNGDLPTARIAAPAQVMAAFEAPAMAPIATDAPAVVSNAKADFSPAAIQPHDLTTLVDRLVEARENARTATGAVTVMHADFGEVSLKFGHDNGNLTVSLANNDPGFVRAVNAAVAADSGAMGNEAAFQGDRRDGGQGASTRTAADNPNSSADRGTGRERDTRDGRTDRNEPHSQTQGQAARRARGGIFA